MSLNYLKILYIGIIASNIYRIVAQNFYLIYFSIQILFHFDNKMNIFVLTIMLFYLFAYSDIYRCT